MALRVSKRGFFFTFIAIFVVSVIYVFFMVNNASQSMINAQTAGKGSEISRASSINDYVSSFHSTLLKRAVLVSGYNALRSMIDYSVDQRVFYSDIQTTFKEIIMNGTIGGNPLDTDYGIFHMRNTTFPFLMSTIHNKTEEFLGINMSYAILNVTIEQNNETGPWQVAFTASVWIFVDGDTAEWDTLITASGLSSLYDLEDAYVGVSSANTHRRYIKRTNITAWNMTHLQEFIGSEEYKYEESAPSFLMRLGNDMNGSSCCGIESLINWPSTRNMSFVDYCYYGGSCEGSNPLGNFTLFNITGITTPAFQFKLEPYHITETKYNVTDYSVITP